MIQINFLVTKIIHESAGSPFKVILGQKDDGRTVRICGEIPGMYPNMQYRVWGKETYHKTYGPQIEVEGYEPLTQYTDNLDALAEFLASGAIKYVGVRVAAAIVRQFGEDTVRVLNEEPSRLIEVNGIGEATWPIIAESWREVESIRFIVQWFMAAGKSVKLAVKAHDKWGHLTMDILNANPYELIALPGVGFRTADEIALQHGIATDDPRRIAAGVGYVLSGYCQDTGCTFGHSDFIIAELSKQLIVDAEAATVALQAEIDKGSVIAQGDRLYPARLYHAERNVAKMLDVILTTPALLNADQTFEPDPEELREFFGFELDDSQVSAIRAALNNKFTVLTGGPGTGKTTIIKAILRYAQKLNISHRVMAPTGRAAKQVEESTGYEGQTLHRALRFKGDHFETVEFDESLIVVDETSMVDICLADQFLQRVRPDARVVVVGDVDQLPSIGPGQFFRDMIVSNHRISVQVLKTIHRQGKGSTLVKAIASVRQGRPITFDSAVDGSIFLKPVDAASDIGDVVVDYVTRRFPVIGVQPDQVMVLSPKKVGDGGANKLNEMLRQALNPPRVNELSYGRFRPRDRVMQLENAYDRDVFNGDMGTVTSVTEEGIYVMFDGNNLQFYKGGECNALTYAWAMSVHKSQGGQYPWVVLVMHKALYPMLTREILYTGMSRARQGVVIVGTHEAVQIAIRHVDEQQRETSLAEWLI